MPQVEIRLLKQLASALATPMFVVSPEGDLVFFNESAEALVGRRFDEIGEVGRDDWPVTLNMTDGSGKPIRPEDRPVIAALDQRRPVHRQVSTRGLDGVTHTLHGTGIPLISSDGELLGGLGIFWEAERSRVYQRAVRRGTHDLEVILVRRLAAHLAVPIFLVDAGLELLYFNDAARPFFGRDLDELIGVPTGEIYAGIQPADEDGSTLKLEDHPVWVAGADGRPAHRRFSVRSLDGPRHSVESTAIPLIGQAGELHGVAGFFWELDA